MRIVVFSDSHGNYAALQNALLDHEDADLFLHLGDGEREFEDLGYAFPEKRMLGVSGNCDWNPASDAFRLVTCAGRRIFLAHGHTFGVKSGLRFFLRAAREADAEIALFGHTHQAHTEYLDGLYVLNPGSIAAPRGGPRSYGVVDITAAGIVTRLISSQTGEPL